MAPRISAGVATLRANDTAESLLSRADGAMCVAKRAGGGRVAWAGA